MWRRFEWLLALALATLLMSHALATFSYSELENINRSCSGRGSCERRRATRLDLNTWDDANCLCDDLCITYGDCCVNANAIDFDKMPSAVHDFECVEKFPYGSFYMKGSCHPRFSTSDVADLCMKESREDLLLQVPVTSLASDITYKNIYCAVCNYEEMNDLEVWSAQMACPPTSGHSSNSLKENVSFINGSWGLCLNNTNEICNDFVMCNVLPVVKDEIVHKLRQCISYITTCSSNWTDSTVEELCHSYTTVVYGPYSLNSNVFRNYHCALCNWVNEFELTCYERNFRQAFPVNGPNPFSLLFDFGKDGGNCVFGEIWDPFSKKCREVVCLDESFTFKNGRCVKIGDLYTKFDNVTSDNTTNLSKNEKLQCDKLFINESDFTRGDNDSIQVNLFRRTYENDEYETYREGILVCIPNSYSRLMGWLTVFGLGISCVCLLLHLIAFIVVPDLRNLSGKNLASMCIALLIAYVCFLVTSLEESGTNSCPVLASVMYYFFLASFSWMNVMAFDIWRTLKMATSELRLNSGSQWKKFFCYFIYAWTLPLVLLIVVLAIDYTKPDWINPSYLPELGHKFCWFGQKNAILIYFAAPLSAIMLLNIIFFILAVRMVTITAMSTVALTCSKPHQIQLKLCLKLALLMGLSWISGIIAGYIQKEYMWYLFILLNAFQGLFILIGFTCTKKVLRAFKASGSMREVYGKVLNNSKKSSSRQVLESQDSGHSQLSQSQTSSTNLSVLSPVNSKALQKSPKV